MKVGSEPDRDPQRVRRARARDRRRTCGLFVDANGAYSRKQALALAETFVAEAGVSWFEEPVSSDDLEGLRLLRDRAPAGMDIAAGEYGYDLFYFRRMLDAGAVDVLQADVTRCGGITQMLQVAALCAARGMRLSAHTSPTIHAHVCAAIEPLEHVEYFHDHARIEELLFDGRAAAAGGRAVPRPRQRQGWDWRCARHVAGALRALMPSTQHAYDHVAGIYLPDRGRRCSRCVVVTLAGAAGARGAARARRVGAARPNGSRSCTRSCWRAWRRSGLGDLHRGDADRPPGRAIPGCG